VGREGAAGFKPRIDVAEHQFFGAGPSQEGEAIEKTATRRGGSILTAKYLRRERLGIDSALIAQVRDLLAFRRKVQVFGMRQHEIQRHQTDLDGLRLLLAAIAADLVSDSPIERPEPQVEYLPIAGEDMSAPMSAVEQIGEEVFAPFAALNADPGVELTPCEVASVKGDEREKLGISRGVTEPLDVGDLLVRSNQRSAHKVNTWAVNSRPSHSPRRPRQVEFTL
jgi:hypothetical protein